MDIEKYNTLVQKIKKKFFGSEVDFTSSNYEFEVLCEPEKKEVSLPIFLDNHLLKITGTVASSNLKTEFEWLKKTVMEYGATKIFKVNNVRMSHSGLWHGNNYYLNRNIVNYPRLDSVELNSATLVDSDNSAQYFGHWLTDFFPATLVANNKRPALSISKPEYIHAKDYLQLYSIDNVIYANRGFISELYFLDDFFTYNSYKLKRFKELSQRLKDKIPLLENNYSGVYIARGTTGTKRTLVNENYLIEYLTKKGFYILYPENSTAAEIAIALLNTSFVISVEGSALSHAILARSKRTGFLILMPPNRCTFFYKGILDALDHAWGFYVCNSKDTESFYLDSFDDLSKLIDLIKSKL